MEQQAALGVPPEHDMQITEHGMQILGSTLMNLQTCCKPEGSPGQHLAPNAGAGLRQGSLAQLLQALPPA